MGQYLHFHIDQQGVDVYVDILTPHHGRLFRADTPNGKVGPEEVHLVADRAGRYRLEVGAFRKGGTGRYTARLEALRPARPADISRAAAQQAFRQAEPLKNDRRRFFEVAAQDEKALRLWEGLGDREPQLAALHSLGQLYFDRGQSGDALEIFRREHKLSVALAERRGIALSLNGLGETYGTLGDFAAAESAYQGALKIWRRRGEPISEASTLTGLGQLYEVHGQTWQALDCFRQARDLAHRNQAHATEVNALNGMGWVYDSVGDPKRALESHKQAVALLDEASSLPLQVATLTQLGASYLHAGKLGQALPVLHQALDLERDPAAADQRAVTLSALGLCFERQNDAQQALDAYAQVLGTFAEHPNAVAETAAHVNLGWIYGQLHQYERALKEYGEALERAKSGQDRGAEALALLGMARAEWDRGNPIMARAYGEQGLPIMESLRSEAVRPDLEASFLAWHETYYSLLIEVLMAQHREQPRRDFARQAFELSERSRVRRLLDALSTDRDLRAGRIAGADPALLARWNEITTQIDVQDIARRQPIIGTLGASRDAAERALSDLLDQQGELEEQIRRRAHRPAAATPLAMPDFGQLQRTLLDPHTVLLEYTLDEPQSFLWVLSSDGGIQSFELPGRASLEPRIKSWSRSLAAGDRQEESDTSAAGDAGSAEEGSGAGDREARELSRLLLGPAMAHLDGKRLLIAVSGALQYVPFAALPDPGGRDGPLALRHEIVYIPSLAALAALRDRAAARQPPAGMLAILADPVFGPSDARLGGAPSSGVAAPGDELPRLSHSGEEADAIRLLAGGGQVLEIKGFDATRERVKSGELSGYRILHFATHGTLRPDRPDQSALPAIVLSLRDRQGHRLDGYLRPHDLEHLDLPADLVVLSACGTALGPQLEGEGMFGLPQAFLSAGVQRVLVSLWNVGDLATKELMRRFYGHLLTDHLRAGEALRRAQMEMSQQPQWRDPSHWAAFVLLGDPN